MESELSTDMPSSTTIHSFDNAVAASFLHTRLYTTGRDHHEYHNHFYGAIENTSFASSQPRLGNPATNSVDHSEDSPVQCAALEEINALDELLDRRYYRVHSAKYRKSFVIVKVFEGSRAKESFEKAVRTSRSLLHPNMLRMAAISFPKSRVPFIVYDSSCESGSIESRVASALTGDLPRSIKLGFQIVGGLSAGLDYLSNSYVPIRGVNVDRFEVYFTQDDTVKIGIDTCEANADSEDHGEGDSGDAIWTLFDGLCTKTFTNANRLLYQEENAERHEVASPNIVDLEPGSVQENVWPNTVVSAFFPTTLTASSDSTRKPRRELVWNGSRRGKSTVASVARQYRNHLRTQFPNALALRRVKAGRRVGTVKHRCQGYNREEITLTSDIKDNAIVSHSVPTPYERCHICGKLVSDNDSVGEQMDIGRAYEQQKDYVRAKDVYERIVVNNPGHAGALQQLGWLYHQDGSNFQNQETAIQYLTKSLEADSSDAQSWYLLGRAYMAEQTYTKAYEAYQQAVYRDGRNPTFWCSIGVLYFQINQFRDALDAYTQAIRINPYIPEVWFNLGSLYESCNNQIFDAIDAYVRASELDPSNTVISSRLQLLRNAQSTGVALPAVPRPQDIHPTAYADIVMPTLPSIRRFGS